MVSRAKYIFVGAALLLVSCAVGPDFKEPAPPPVKSYTEDPVSKTSLASNVEDGDAQEFQEGVDLEGAWWEVFHSRALSELVEQSLKENPDMQASQAALAVAQENVKAQLGAYYPSITATFSGSRQKTSEEIAPVPNSNKFFFNLYTPQLSISYVPDVFGLNRRTVESLEAEQDLARYELAATDITLSSNVVVAAIQEAALRGQVEATHQLIDINVTMLNILKNQLKKGYASQIDVAAQESQLAQVNATLPPLLKQLAVQRDLLKALAGQFPAQELKQNFTLADLKLPTEIPLSLPSKLVEQRPDILQAEANLHFASASIGIAVANRLPNITLTADAGDTALRAGKIFHDGVDFWDLGGEITQPIFEGGMLWHKEKAARAAYKQALAEYKSTILTAFQNVADSLSALIHDADALKASSEALSAAKVTLDLSRKQTQSGYANYLTLLNAEQVYQQALINLVQARANRLSDTAALFQALGGGWWKRAELS